MTTNKKVKEPTTKAEALSLLLLAIALYIVLSVAVLSIGAVALMLAWGLIAPIFGLPLLNFAAAFGIVSIVWVIGKFLR